MTVVSTTIPQIKNWKEHAEKAIQECDAFLCVVGEKTHASENVEWEIEQAEKFGKPIAIFRRNRKFELPKCCKKLMKYDLMEGKALDAHWFAKIISFRLMFEGSQNWKSPGDMVWNQYSLMVQTSESLINRRQTVNLLYMTANGFLIAAIATLAASADKLKIQHIAFGVGVFSFLGLLINSIWVRTILSYGILNHVKYQIITEIGQLLPLKLFDAEWIQLQALGYKSTTKSDSRTAKFFLVLFTCLAAASTVVASVSYSWEYNKASIQPPLPNSSSDSTTKSQVQTGQPH